MRGIPTLIDDSAWLLRQLTDLTRQHEQQRPAPWSVHDAPADYIAAQMKAIVGIEIQIETLSGKFKMSQNRSPEDRDGVLAGISNPDDPHFNPEVADLIRNT